jgi:hypothetical protein
MTKWSPISRFMIDKMLLVTANITHKGEGKYAKRNE